MTLTDSPIMANRSAMIGPTTWCREAFPGLCKFSGAAVSAVVPQAGTRDPVPGSPDPLAR